MFVETKKAARNEQPSSFELRHRVSADLTSRRTSHSERRFPIEL